MQAVLLGLLSNPTFWIYLVIFLAIVLLILYMRRNWNKLKSWRIFQKDGGDYSEGIGGISGSQSLQSDRKKYLEDLANRLYSQIYTTFAIDKRDAHFKEALALNDSELKYLAQYYKRYVTRGNTLWTDVDDEWMPWSAPKRDLLARLSKIGEK